VRLVDQKGEWRLYRKIEPDPPEAPPRFVEPPPRAGDREP
jgi:hypothetical protein